MQRTALVTGGNRGLGLATARALAEASLTVIIGARDPAAGESARTALAVAGLAVEVVHLDVADPTTVTAAAARVRRRHGALDVLVNNAGVLPEAVDEGREAVDVELFRRTFEVNLFGAVAVTEAFLPLLRVSPSAAIVNVSSTMGSLTDQSNPASPYYAAVAPAYQASKAALNSVTIGLAKRLVGTGITVTSVCPGHVRTDLAPGNREQAPLDAHVAARVVVDAALARDAPTGRFVSAEGAVAW
jgi:NAD(P)-dependent dehydrogenase (short-subunit alcohol dehydrogenase family)